MSRSHLPYLVVLVAVAVLGTACTTADTQGAVVTRTVGQDPVGVATTATPSPSDAPNSTPGSSPGPSTTVETDVLVSSSSAVASSSPPAPSTSTPAVIKPAVTTVPKTGATGVSPIAPVRATVDRGIFTEVTMTNPEGRAIEGALSKDKRTWISDEPLGYGRTYTLTAAARTPAGVSTDAVTTFTTLKPKQMIFPSFFPNPQIKTVGVGQPMVVIFDKAPTDRAAAERALTVTTVPAVEGAWFWWDDRTLHYRPKAYWKAGTKITVNAKIYGRDLGGGVYGETDRTLTVTVGPKKVAKIDDATKQMQIFIDDKLQDTVPVSMGMDKTVTVNGKKIDFITPSGIYVAQERYKVKQMSSATYGLPVNADTGYDKAIPLAVRISNEGVFVHSAPWSVKDQGVRNVSHGCININPTAGQWFYDNFSYGDIVEVTGTSTRLAPTDGFGDWNIPWDEWLRGSALPAEG